MPKFGHVFISGTLWVLIASAIGWWSLSLADSGGVVGILWWSAAFLAFCFVGMSLLHLFRAARGQLHASRWMRDNPEEFAQATAEYERANQRIQDDEPLHE